MKFLTIIVLVVTLHIVRVETDTFLSSLYVLQALAECKTATTPVVWPDKKESTKEEINNVGDMFYWRKSREAAFSASFNPMRLATLLSVIRLNDNISYVNLCDSGDGILLFLRLLSFKVETR